MMTANQNQVGMVNGFGGLVLESPITSPVLKAHRAALGQGPKGTPDTPSTQCSTAPNTPALMGSPTMGNSTMPNTFTLDDDDDYGFCSDFPEVPVMRVGRCRLSSVEEKAASTDDDDVQEETFEYNDETSMEIAQKEDAKWTVHRGAPPSLEQSLNEVKALYHDTFEEDVDAPLQEDLIEYSDGASMKVVQKDNVKWIVHRGGPPSVSALEQNLAEVKALYMDRFGEDAEEETHEYSDGTSMKVVQKDDVKWIVHRGAPPSMSALEQSLAEVKALYMDNFGEDAEKEKHVYSDGTSMEVLQKDDITWTVHRGAPPSTSALERTLNDVKSLYHDKFGKDVDAESVDDLEDVEEEKNMVAGRGPPPSTSALQQGLDEMKRLFTEKFGEDWDSDSTDDEDSDDEEIHKYSDGTSMKTCEKDGVKWIVQRGVPPSMTALEQMLDEVKVLYKRKFVFGESSA